MVLLSSSAGFGIDDEAVDGEVDEVEEKDADEDDGGFGGWGHYWSKKFFPVGFVV